MGGQLVEAVGGVGAVALCGGQSPVERGGRVARASSGLARPRSRRLLTVVADPTLVSQVWVWCAIPFPMSDPYDESPPWNLPWPDNPFPPPAATAFATPLAPAPPLATHTLAYTPPPIASSATIAGTEVGQAAWAANAIVAGRARQVQFGVVKRELSGRYWGMGKVGMRVAELAGRAAGWTVQSGVTSTQGFDDVRRPEVDDFRSLRAQGDGAATLEADDRLAARDEKDDDLPVDANFYFFLFVCEYGCTNLHET